MLHQHAFSGPTSPPSRLTQLTEQGRLAQVGGQRSIGTRPARLRWIRPAPVLPDARSVRNPRPAAHGSEANGRSPPAGLAAEDAAKPGSLGGIAGQSSATWNANPHISPVWDRTHGFVVESNESGGNPGDSASNSSALVAELASLCDEVGLHPPSLGHRVSPIGTVGTSAPGCRRQFPVRRVFVGLVVATVRLRQVMGFGVNTASCISCRGSSSVRARSPRHRW